MDEKPNSDKFVGLGRSDELIARAEKLVDEITLPVRTDIFDTEGNLANLVPELVAEIKRLRSREKNVAMAIDSLAEIVKRYVLMNHEITKFVFEEADSLVDYSEKLEKIVIAKDARIAELEGQNKRLEEALFEAKTGNW